MRRIEAAEGQESVWHYPRPPRLEPWPSASLKGAPGTWDW